MGGLANISPEIKAALVSYTTVLGLKVFPVYEVKDGKCSCNKDCSPRNAGKHPRIDNWQRNATDNIVKALRWWEKWPEANIGCVTGSSVGAFVVDIDKYEAWESLNQPIPDTWSFTTAGGGRHLWFNYPADLLITNSSGTLPDGIDIRGTGGFVIMPPSRTLKGTYRSDGTATPDRRLDAPEWLIERLRVPEATRGTLVEEKGLKSFGDLDSDTQARYKRYVQGVIDSEIETLQELTDTGSTKPWNNTTYLTACNLFELAKAPWSPLLSSEAEDHVRENVPPFDDEGWNEIVLDKLLESAYKRIFHNSGVRDYPPVRPTTPRSGVGSANGVRDKNKDWEKAGEVLERKLTFTPISTIKTESVEWCWTNRIPTGEITLLAGREGIGKSVIAAWLAAQMTTGNLDGKHRGTPKGVVYLATEDSWSKTIVPRLVVAGCNTETVFKVELQHDPLLGLVLPKDIEELKEGIKRHNIGMIILDPFLSFVDMGLDVQKTRATRQALEPLAQMAHDTGCAVVGLIHFTKSDTNNILDKIAESKAFTQVCRQVMVVGTNPNKEEKGWGLLSVGKANLAPGDVPSIEYQIVGQFLQTDDGKASNVGKLLIHGETQMSAITMIQQETDPRAYETKDCAEWLGEILAEKKAAWFKDIKEEAKRAGYNEYTLRKAKENLGISHKKLGGMGVGTAWFIGITEDEARAILKVGDAEISKEQMKKLKTELDI